jgi:CDP-glucose 4,6-dehydratase
MQAQVYGFALPPSTTPSLYALGEVAEGMHSTFGDIRVAEPLATFIKESSPEIVLHLAAQAIVSEGYADPTGTYATNVMGTVHLLDAVRTTPGIKSIVVITSDKCYENHEWEWPYRETDSLGGHDPYSNSKACTELVAAAFRQSFLAAKGIGLATARAGNVFGGGDWSKNRLIPDLLSAFSTGQPALLRNPESIRPWQHVLEPLAGYLRLAELLYDNPKLAGSFNFGPRSEDTLSVAGIATELSKAWGENARFQCEKRDFPHEAGQLRLDSSLAQHHLGWKPRLSLQQGLTAAVNWQKAWLSGNQMRDFTLNQISEYMSL